MEIPTHSARPRIAWATKLSRKRVPKRTLAPLADTTVGASVKLIPAAATVISAKSIIQPRIFYSWRYGPTWTYALPPPSYMHACCQSLFSFSSVSRDDTKRNNGYSGLATVGVRPCVDRRRSLWVFVAWEAQEALRAHNNRYTTSRRVRLSITWLSFGFRLDNQARHA